MVVFCFFQEKAAYELRISDWSSDVCSSDLHVSLVAEERTVKGSYVGSCVALRDVPRYIALYRRGRLPVDRQMSERLTLEQINEGFDRLADGHTVRQIITP